MSNLFDEIDDLLRRTNKIYLSYTICTLSASSYLLSLTKYSRTVKIFAALSSTLILSGTLTWIHVFYTYSPKELGFLNVGLEKSYPSLKDSKSKQSKS